MEKNHYPNAGDVLSQIEMMLAEQQQQAQMMQEMGDMSNEMPVMPSGIENNPIP
jgi:hypothetical protein